MQYHTGLVVKPSIKKLIQKMEGLAETVSFNVNKKFSVVDDEKVLNQITNVDYIDKYEFNNSSETKCSEIILNCESDEDAQNYLSIIKAGIHLTSPSILGFTGLECPIKFSEHSTTIIHEQPIWDQYICYDNLDIALFILESSLKNNEYIYALEKYKFSVEVWADHSISMHPNYGQVFDNTSRIDSEHVLQLMSILSAYSIIEELGLEVRSSSKKPRFTDNEDKTWNSEVWDNLEKRLLEKNIDISYELQWTVRGDNTLIHDDEKYDYEKFGQPSKYNDGEINKDRSLHIIDAIHLSSWLRNFVAAHKYSHKAAHISPYDVHNVQMTSRYLLMQCLDVWNYVIESNKIIY